MGNCFSKTKSSRDLKRSGVKIQTPEVVYHKIPEVTEECTTLKLSLITAQREKEAAEEAVQILNRRVHSLENVVRDLQDSVEHASLVDRERKSALQQLQHKQTQLDQLRQVNSSIETEHTQTLAALNKLVLELEERMRVDEERRIELMRELLRLQKEADEREKMLAEQGKQEQARTSNDLDLMLAPTVASTNQTSQQTIPTNVNLRRDFIPSNMDHRGEEENREALDAVNRKRLQRKSWNQKDQYNEESLLSLWAQKGPIQVCIAKYNYDPFELSPNENPEVELPLTAGDYVLVAGEMDEDGFFDGELIDGTQGLVPSNYIEKVEDEDLLDFHEALLQAGHKEYILIGERGYSYTGHTPTNFLRMSSSVVPLTPVIFTSLANVINNNREDSHPPSEEGRYPVAKRLNCEIEDLKRLMSSGLSPQASATSAVKSVDSGFGHPPWSALEDISEDQPMEPSDGEEDNKSRDTDDEIDEAFRDYPNEGIDAANESYSGSSHTELSDIPEVEEDLIGSKDSLLNEAKRTSPDQSAETLASGKVDSGASKVDAQKQITTGGKLLATFARVVLATEQLKHVDDKEDHTRLREDNTHSRADNTISREDNTRSRADNTCSREDNTHSRADNTISREDNTCSREDNTHSRADNTILREDNTHLREDNTHSRADNSRSREDNTNSRGDNTHSRGDNTHSRGDNTHSREDNTCSREDNTCSRVDNTRSRADNTRSRADNTRSREDNTRSREDNTHSRADNTHSRADNTRDRDDNIRSREDNTHSRADNTHSRADNTRSREDTTHSREDNTHSREDNTRSREDNTHSREDNTHSREDNTHTREDNTRSREDNTHSREDNTRSREDNTHLREDNTRSKEGNTPSNEMPPRDLAAKRQTLDTDGSRPNYKDAPDPSTVCQGDQSPHRSMKDPVLPAVVEGKNRKCDDHQSSTQGSRTRSSKTHPPKLNLQNSRDDLDLVQSKAKPKKSPRPLSDSTISPNWINLSSSPIHPSDDTTHSCPEGIKPVVKAKAVRLFIALFDYDPATMSPNIDSVGDELPFREGQILKVFGHKDADGFYWGENNGRVGYVPCNMVCEIQIDDSDLLEKLLQEVEDDPEEIQHATESHSEGAQMQPNGEAPMPREDNLARQMTALFDYNPNQLSPIADAEMSFKIGDLVTIYGDVDQDGFYTGEVNNKKGLVPANFLRPAPTDDNRWDGTCMSKARSCESLERALEILERSAVKANSANTDDLQLETVNSNKQPVNTSLSETKSGSTSSSKDEKSKSEGFFSKSKNILKKFTR